MGLITEWMMNNMNFSANLAISNDKTIVFVELPICLKA